MTHKVAHCRVCAQLNSENMHALLNGSQQDWLATAAAPDDTDLPA